MTYASVCDGIGAVHCAWQPLGWRCAWTSEIEKFPIAVVEARSPGIPNLGDMTEITQEMIDERGPIDLLVAGTPCQSFSVAGLRGGLGDARGNLALRFMQLVGACRPRWVLWENVPGVLSSSGGRDFGSILGALEELGYGWAYRTLDAQWFGVAQRRRRVFVVGHLGDWRRAAAVLFERESVRGDPPTREAARQGPAPDAGRGSSGASWWDGGQLSQTLDAVLSKGQSPTLNHFDVGDTRATTVVAFSIREDAKAGNFSATPADVGLAVQAHQPSVQSHHAQIFIAKPMAVRRLTPRECERLQGFPDDYTLVPWRNKPAEDCPDGPRYRALGNSMAVPVMRWIGERIAMVDAIEPSADAQDYKQFEGPYVSL